MGGQYALAVAHGLAGRVDQVIVVAGCAPLDEPAHFALLSSLDQRLTRLSQRAPVVARSAFFAMRTTAARAPQRFLRSSRRTMGPSDGPVLDRPDTRYVQLVREGLARTSGAADEYETWVKPWRFAPGEVRAPAQLWWGADDRLVARGLMQPLADQLPHASFHVVPDAGHFVAFDRWRDVLAPVTA
jgi:pimeloyl-ACP methyl ester carboxylesterase